MASLQSLVSDDEIIDLPVERRRAYVCFALISQIGKQGVTVGEVVKIVNNVTFQSFTPYQIKNDIEMLLKLSACGMKTKMYASGRKIVRYNANSETILMLGVYYRAMSKLMREMALPYVVDCSHAASNVYRGIYQSNNPVQPTLEHLVKPNDGDL